MSKIKIVSVMQTVNMFTNEESLFTKDEGEVSYNLVPMVINGKQFTNVEIFKVKNGRKVKLYGDEYTYELYYGALKDDPKIQNRPMPTYADYLQEEQKRAKGTVSNGFGTKQNKSKWFDMNTKMF